MLLAEVDGPLSDEARDNLTVLRRSADHLRALIDDILDLSALESGELKLDTTAIDVFVLAAEIVREARVTAESKSLEVRLEGFNVFNHGQFFGPAAVHGYIGNPNFGQIVSAASPRILQVAGKFYF